MRQAACYSIVHMHGNKKHQISVPVTGSLLYIPEHLYSTLYYVHIVNAKHCVTAYTQNTVIELYNRFNFVLDLQGQCYKIFDHFFIYKKLFLGPL